MDADEADLIVAAELDTITDPEKRRWIEGSLVRPPRRVQVLRRAPTSSREAVTVDVYLVHQEGDQIIYLCTDERVHGKRFGLAIYPIPEGITITGRPKGVFSDYGLCGSLEEAWDAF